MQSKVEDFPLKTDQLVLSDLGKIGPVMGLVGLYLAFTLMSDRFLTVGNQINVLRQASIIGMLAIASTFPILCAEIDLSIAQMLEFIGFFIVAIATGNLFALTLPVPLAVLVGLSVAATLGAVSGVITSRMNIPSFMTTLAILFLVDGLGLAVSNNQTIANVPPSLAWLGGSEIYGFPTIIIAFLSLLIISQLVLSYTRFGLYIYAVGEDRESARLNGINVSRVRIAVLVISAVFAGFAGILMVGRINFATPAMGQGLLLPPIAAVILGGADLFGGRGNMFGTFVGVMILSILANGLNLMGVDISGQLIAQGIILLLAILVNVIRRSDR